MSTDTKHYTRAELDALGEGVTPGPWEWKLSIISRQALLRSVSRGVPTVIDFVRWGMQHAAPRFCVDGLMETAEALACVVSGREHHATWHQNIDHPDARLISAAPGLLAQCTAQAEEIERLRTAVAWQAGELTEGQAARLAGLDRVMLRKLRDDCATDAYARWEQYREGTTDAD